MTSPLLLALVQAAQNNSEATAEPQLWTEVVTLFGALLILLGAVFTIIAALGLFRFNDLFARMHAASKPQMLGLLLICTGIVLTLRTWHWVLVCIVVVAIQLLAAPIGSHMLGRTAYRTKVGQLSALVADELSEDSERPNADNNDN